MLTRLQRDCRFMQIFAGVLLISARQQEAKVDIIDFRQAKVMMRRLLTRTHHESESCAQHFGNYFNLRPIKCFPMLAFLQMQMLLGGESNWLITDLGRKLTFHFPQRSS